MKKDGGRFVWLAILIIVGFSDVVESATLTSPARNGGEFQFELQGDSYRHYVIQGSPDLVNWVSLATNISPSATRDLSFAASNEFQFYRSAPFIQTNSVSKAIRLSGSFDLNGNNFVVDSFNSTNSAFSTAGQYDPLKRNDMAELSLDQGLTNSLAIGNASIYGGIATGAGAPLLIGPYGSIGDKGWQDAAKAGIQPGKFSIDLNPYFPDAEIPFTNGNSPLYNIVVTNTVVTDGNVTNYFVTTYDMVFEHGDYIASTLTGKILVGENARVYVTDDINLTNSSDIIHIKTNASLKLYVDAADVRIGGDGIINESGNATNFVYYGRSSNTNLSLYSVAPFTGIIYAPRSRIDLGAGGNDVWDFVGAIVARSLRLNGHWLFHYDEALWGLPFPNDTIPATEKFPF